MSIVMAFKKPPLVEVIAELRWNTTSPTISFPSGNENTNLHQFVQMDDGDVETFIMRFGGFAHVLGFSQAERLVPAGFPAIAHQPIYRFRSANKPTTNSLYQIGMGLFTANATTSYDSWNVFSATIKEGVEALLKSRSDLEKDALFNVISLRYINAFDHELTDGRDITTFLEDVFKLRINLPSAISKNMIDGGKFTPMLQLRLPMNNGVLMDFSVGEGISNNELVVAMDTTVVTTTPVVANVAAVMDALQSAHDVIHEMFYALTAPMSDLIRSQDGAD